MLLILILFVILVVTCFYYFRRNKFNPDSLKGKRVLVTGASSGIGEQVAYTYAKFGARLMLTARREILLKQVTHRCKQLGADQVEYVVTDLGNPNDRKHLVDETKRLLKGLDHLILDHALFCFDYWTNSEQSIANLQNILNVNAVSYVDIASKCLEMLKESHGNIGVMSSIDGKIGLPKCIEHAMSKFAIQGFFLTWRQELKHNNVPVSVTLIINGPTATVYKTEATSFCGMHAATVEDTATAIVKGVTERAIEVYQPVSVKISVWLHKFFPRIIEDYNYSCFDNLITIYQENE